MLETEAALYDVGCTPRSVVPLQGVRGSVVLGGRKLLRDRGLYDAYRELLPPDAILPLDAVIASEIVPMDLVHVHESAIDRLRLPRETAREMGNDLSRLLNGATYSTIVRLVGGMGASPWVVFAQGNKTWARLYRGGAVAVFRCGEKAARIEVWGDSLARYAMHREAFAGALYHIVTSYCWTPSMNEIARMRAPTSFAISARW